MDFCLTEVPIAMMLEETDGYKMGQPGEWDLKRTHIFFTEDLKVYQEKRAEVIFKNGKMVKEERLAVLEKRTKALDPEQNEMLNFSVVSK